MTRLRSGLANLALLLFSIAVVLGGVEVALRVAGRISRGGKEQRTRRLYTEHDPLLGWRKKPGERVIYERGEFRTDVTINRKGLRDREREYAAAPGTFRILALGDSFVEAFMVPLEQAVTQQLEAILGAQGCPVEVINGGTVGYSTDQEYLFYQEEGYKYSAQVVILFVYYNDILFNNAGVNLGLPKPRLVREGQELRVANYPVPPAPPAPPPEPPPRVRGSVALDWIGQRLESSAPRAYNRLARLKLWPPIRPMTAAGELGVYLRRPGREIEQAWDMTHAIVRALHRRAGARGSRLMLVYIPSRMEVHQATWELSRLRYGWGEKNWDRDEVGRRLGEVARVERIPLLDLTAALRRADSWWRPTYFAHDKHWNAHGQRVAARAIRDYLRQVGWLPGCVP